MKFVFPATCSGAPPLMIAIWPDSSRPAFRAQRLLGLKDDVIAPSATATEADAD
jgi:hypothetical protein